VLGIMDRRGDAQPFLFMLRRSGAATPA
jgi:hypothetical protein